MPYLVGIDGGGMKTQVAIATLEGAILSTGQSGPSNYLKAPIPVVKGSILEAVKQASRGVKRPLEFSVVCGGFSGIDHPEGYRVMESILRETLRLSSLFLFTDAEIALQGAFNGKPGIIVIAGSGSIAFGKDLNGKTARVGGWGHLIGDDGSGYELVRMALKETLKSANGSGKASVLQRKIQKHFHLERLEQVLVPLYANQGNPSQLCSLFPVLLQAAKERDRTAISLLKEGGRSLAALARAAALKLDYKHGPVPITFGGSIFEGNRILMKAFTGEIRAKISKGELRKPIGGPLVGAISLAKEALTSGEHFKKEHA